MLSIIRQVYGPEAMVRVKEDQAGLAWEGGMGQDAVHQVATQLWQEELVGKEACDAGVMYDGPCYAGIDNHNLPCISSQARG